MHSDLGIILFICDSLKHKIKYPILIVAICMEKAIRMKLVYLFMRTEAMLYPVEIVH